MRRLRFPLGQSRSIAGDRLKMASPRLASAVSIARGHLGGPILATIPSNAFSPPMLAELSNQYSTPSACHCFLCGLNVANTPMTSPRLRASPSISLPLFPTQYRDPSTTVGSRPRRDRHLSGTLRPSSPTGVVCATALRQSLMGTRPRCIRIPPRGFLSWAWRLFRT